MELNLRAFEWGRLAAIDPAGVERIAGLATTPDPPETLDGLISRLSADLAGYQDANYARRYQDLIGQVRAAVQQLGSSGDALVEIVARNAYSVMAYKDEYEVARLYSEPAFRAELAAQFAGSKRVSLYLAPPMLSRVDPATGRPAKRRFGPWIFPVMTLLAKAKRIRGGWADPFGRTAERRAERVLRDEYLSDIEALCAKLTPSTLHEVNALAALPTMVRGFGPVKEQAMAAYRSHRANLLLALEVGPSRRDAA